MENEDKTVTPRDYTLIELRRKSKQQARRMFWIGMLMGIALFILLAFFLGIRIG